MEQTHPIAVWLAEAGESRVAFAGRVGISESHLSLILSWKRGASLDVAARFERATNGEVKAVDMVMPEAAE